MDYAARANKLLRGLGPACVVYRYGTLSSRPFALANATAFPKPSIWASPNEFSVTV